MDSKPAENAKILVFSPALLVQKKLKSQKSTHFCCRKVIQSVGRLKSNFRREKYFQSYFSSQTHTEPAGAKNSPHPSPLISTSTGFFPNMLTNFFPAYRFPILFTLFPYDQIHPGHTNHKC